ncbi:WxcM-like domain-containing protein [Streptomyces sp. URMC 123]|uniref:WxcM-like domain-containing protein n=1 Tax=Streptomyces sp. URMC 123 TaxID=3423403 RepID=UPI003F1CDD49
MPPRRHPRTAGPLAWRSPASERPPTRTRTTRAGTSGKPRIRARGPRPSTTGRYTAGAATFHTPARLADDLPARAARAAVLAHRVLDLRQLSRTDAIVTARGAAYVLETNVAPGLTPTSSYPLALTAAGYNLGSFLHDLATPPVCSAHGQGFDSRRRERRERSRARVRLNRPDQALHVEPGVWTEFADFSPDAICLVLASAPYELDDYLYDYDEFVRTARLPAP